MKRPTGRDKLEVWTKWLVHLNSTLWGQTAGSTCGCGAHYGPIAVDKGKLTKDQWEAIKLFIKKFKPLCLPGSGTFGFGFSLTLGLLGEGKIDYILSMTGHQLPWVNKYGHTPKNTWDTFARYTHTEENKKLAKFAKEEIKDRAYYEY